MIGYVNLDAFPQKITYNNFHSSLCLYVNFRLNYRLGMSAASMYLSWVGQRDREELMLWLEWPLKTPLYTLSDTRWVKKNYLNYDLILFFFQSLIGNNEHSWGWDLGRNKVYHDSKNQSGETYPRTLSSDETFVVPDKFLRKY